MGKAQDDHGRLSELAKDLKLEGDDLSSFIGDGMKRLGHVARTVWDDAVPDGGGNGGGGDFFSRTPKSGGGGGNGETRRRVGGDHGGGYEG